MYRPGAGSPGDWARWTANASAHRRRRHPPTAPSHGHPRPVRSGGLGPAGGERSALPLRVRAGVGGSSRRARRPGAVRREGLMKRERLTVPGFLFRRFSSRVFLISIFFFSSPSPGRTYLSRCEYDDGPLRSASVNNTRSIRRILLHTLYAMVYIKIRLGTAMTIPIVYTGSVTREKALQRRVHNKWWIRWIRLAF